MSNSWNSTTLTWNNQPKTYVEGVDYVTILSSSMGTWHSWDITKATKMSAPEAGGKPTFRLSCKLSFENGPTEVWKHINFNPGVYKPQPIYGIIDANSVLNEYQKNNNLSIESKKLLKIRIEPNFNSNCNVAYFDNIQVCDDDNSVVYERNEKGSTTAITGNLGNKTTFMRDATSDEVLKIKDYKNNESDFSFRASPKNHQMASSTVPTAGGRVKTEFVHDVHGNVINSVSQAESGQGKTIESTTGYTDSGNYQKSVTDSRGKVTAFNYNENNGNLISSTQNGVTTNYTYDAEGRAISESCNGSQVNYNYSNGILSSVSHKLSENANVVYNFVRDIFGKVIHTKVGNHVLTTNSYDAGDGLLNQVKFANNHQVDYIHDSVGRVIKKNYYSGKDKQNGDFEYVYNNKGELVQTFDEENNLTTKL